MSLTHWFQQGGAFMELILVFDLLAVFMITLMLVLLLGQKTTEKHLQLFRLIVVTAVVIPVCIGALGHYIGYETAVNAIASADPDIKDELFKEAMAVAKISTIFSASSSAALLVAGWLVLSLSKRKI